MARIQGYTEDDLDVLIAEFQGVVEASLRRVAEGVADNLQPALIAHLPGKHNQKDHGHGGSSGGRKKKKNVSDSPALGEEALESVPYRLYVRGPTESKGVSREQMDQALIQYSGSRYGQINGDLRADGPIPPRSRVAVKRIDAAMESSQLTSDVEVHRVVQAGPLAFGGTWHQSMVGVEYRDAGFTSTSANEHIRDVGYKYSQGIAVMRIHVPQGTHAVSLARANDDLEMEILLDRGLSYRVTGDSVVDGVRHLDVEVVTT